MIIDELITNRTAGAKYNASDLNRVTEAYTYLRDLLAQYGYTVDGFMDVVADSVSTAKLPEGYTELEYIESTGTQWIDTGVKPNQDTGVDIKMSVTTKSSDKDYGIFGTRDAGAVNCFLLLNKVDSFRYSYGTQNNNFANFNVDSNDLLNISIRKNSITINGTMETYSTGVFQSSYNALLCAASNGTTVSWTSKGKYYLCDIYDNLTKIKQLVPCKNPSSEVGMYDIVGNQFYGNAGTGIFSAGPEVFYPDEKRYIWQREDIPTPEQMEQYLNNVRIVHDKLLSGSAIPESMRFLTYQGANEIEKALLNLYEAIKSMISAFRWCGTISCNQGGIL